MTQINGLLLPEELTSLPSDPAEIAKILLKHHAADAAEALNSLDLTTAVRTVESLPLDAAVHIFDQPHLERPAKLIESLEHDRAAAIVSEISADRRADIFRKLPEQAHEKCMAKLDVSARQTVSQLITYPPDTAGAIMTTEFLSVPANWTVEQALKLVHQVGDDKETVYVVYVTDPETKQLTQVVSLRQLVTSDPKATIVSIASNRPPITVTPLTDREEVARLLSKYNLLAVPVLAEDRHIIGIVTFDDIIDAIIEEGTEDVQKFGGSEALDGPYLKIGFATMIKKRAGWLCALFLSEMLTASAMQHYEGTIEKAVVLSLFIPLIMSSGGNSGSQATSLIIRALALRDVQLEDWWKIARRELPAGLTLGVILGGIGVIRIITWQKLGLYDYGANWERIALTVGVALIAIVTWGSIIGSMLPFILKRFRFDPATASAPLVATLVDVTGLIIYFSVALLVLRGTLL
jgi:magnesium transporter